MESCARSPRAILLVLIAGIGDFVMATKAIRALRVGHPEAEIHLLTSTEAAGLARNNPRIDRVWGFPIRELRRGPGASAQIMQLIRDLRKIRYDWVINLYPVCSQAGALKMGLLFACLRASLKAGHGKGVCRFFLGRALPGDIFSGKHMTDAMLAVARTAGGKADLAGLELFESPEITERWKNLWESQGYEEGAPVVGIHPGGDRQTRRWPAEHFAHVADLLGERCGAHIMIFGGGAEIKTAFWMAESLQGRVKVINLAGKSSLSDLAHLISRCDLLLANDSGPMHMAAAVNTPVIALFGPGTPLIFGPYGTPDHCRVLKKDMGCSPCEKDYCRDLKCLEAIKPQEVFQACLELLGSKVRWRCRRYAVTDKPGSHRSITPDLPVGREST